MTNLNRLFSEEDEQIISDYTQFNKPQRRQDDDGGGKFDDRRHQRFNDRGDRGNRADYPRQRRDDDRERQQREYELKKAAETKAELRALKEAMKANEDPYKDAMRREDYYRARRRRDMTKLGLLAAAGLLGYGIGHSIGGSDKEKELQKEQNKGAEANKSEGRSPSWWMHPLMPRLYSDIPSGDLPTQIRQSELRIQSMQQQMSQTPQNMQQPLQQQITQEQAKLSEMRQAHAMQQIMDQRAMGNNIQAATSEQAKQQPNLAQNAMSYANGMARKGYEAAANGMGQAYNYLRGLFSDPGMAELVTRHFNIPPQSAGPYQSANSYAQAQVPSPQQPLQSASIGAPARPQDNRPQQGAASQGQRPQMSEEDAKQIQKLDVDIASLQHDNMAKQQQLQQLQQQNLGTAMRNISGYTSQIAPITTAAGNVVRAVGNGAFNAIGDAASGAWNSLKTMFASDTAACVEKYFAEQPSDPKAVIKQKTEVRDKLKKQNEELTEAVEDKENSLGTIFYQLSAAQPALAAQLAGNVGNVVNTGIMGAINLANQGYANLTGGKKLVNTDIIQAKADPYGGNNGQTMTQYYQAQQQAQTNPTVQNPAPALGQKR